MPVPAFIDGVLIYHGEIQEFRSEDHLFSYHRYSFPSTALKPGTFSPVLRILPPIPPIRILYTLNPDTIRHMDLDIASFFRHWLYMSEDLTKTPTHWARHVVFFRDDFETLYPKQVEALWRFCDRLFLIITAPLPEVLLPRDIRCMFFWLRVWKHRDPKAIGSTTSFEFGQLAALMKRIWEDYCTIDNFNAFFELYRRGRLLEGDHFWRDIKCPCDF